MNTQTVSWYEIGSVARVATQMSAAMQNAARGLSAMVRHPITTGTAEARMVRLDDIATCIGHPESETVGVYLLMHGELDGQAILILPLAQALNLVDLLMNLPPGTSSHLGDVERSALSEVGNLTVSYFLNAMAALTGRQLLPSPPAVIVDMLGTILNALALSVGALTDDMLVVETVLQDTHGLVEARLWVLPDLVAQF